MTVHHLGSPQPEVAKADRAVDPSRETTAHQPIGLNTLDGNHCGIHVSRAEQTPAAERAAQAYRDWAAVPASARPLNVAADTVQKMFDELLHGHWMRGDGAYTNEAIGRACGIDEKGVRQWRDGAKRIPLAALMVLPPTLAVETIQWISERRGLGRQQRAVSQLAEAVVRLERPVAAEDREDVVRSLRDARDRIIARLDRLALEGK